MNDQAPPVKSSSSWLTGCLVVIAILIALGGIGAYYAYHQFRALMADAMRVGTVEMVRDSQLPPDQQDDIVVEIDRVVEGFKAGDVGFNELHQVFDQLQQQGVFAYLDLLALHDDHLAPALESDEAAEAARMQIDRVGQAMADRAIREEDIDDALDPHFEANPRRLNEEDWESAPPVDPSDPESAPEPEARWEPSDELTAEDAQEVTESLRELADEAGIDEEVEPMDVAAEVRAAVDSVLDQ